MYWGLPLSVASKLSTVVGVDMSFRSLSKVSLRCTRYYEGQLTVNFSTSARVSFGSAFHPPPWQAPSGLRLRKVP